MKIPLLIIFSLTSIGLYAQRAGNYLKDESWIPPMSSNSYRYEIRQHDSLRVDFTISARRDKKHMLWKNITGMLTFGAVSKIENTEKEMKKPVSINVSLLAGIAGMNVFSKRVNPAPVVEAKQYSSNGTLLRSERLKISGIGKSKAYAYHHRFEQDGFVILTVDNIGRKPLRASNMVQLSYKSPFKTTTAVSKLKPVGINPVTNSETPPCDCLDGGWFSPVTITANTPNGQFDFRASYEANLGPSASWSVSGAGGNSNDSGGDGGSVAADPGPEEKAIVRKLNELKVNKCEAIYILSQGVSALDMAVSLAINESDVRYYMDSHAMSAANINGASKENAFTHALISAYNSCDIGAWPANVMADLHEECFGVNQNPTTQELIMDNYNNDRGFEIAAKVGCNRTDIQNAITDAYYGIGEIRLHDINGNNTN